MLCSHKIVWDHQLSNKQLKAPVSREKSFSLTKPKWTDWLFFRMKIKDRCEVPVRRVQNHLLFWTSLAGVRNGLCKTQRNLRGVRYYKCWIISEICLTIQLFYISPRWTLPSSAKIWQITEETYRVLGNIAGKSQGFQIHYSSSQSLNKALHKLIYIRQLTLD